MATATPSYPSGRWARLEAPPCPGKGWCRPASAGGRVLAAGRTGIRDSGAPQLENPECSRPAAHIPKCPGWLQHPKGQEAGGGRLDAGRCGACGGTATPQRRAAACQACPPHPGRTRHGPRAAKGATGAPPRPPAEAAEAALAGPGRGGRGAERPAVPRGSCSAQPRSNLAARGKFRGRER